MIKLGVMVSGTGTNLQAIIDAINNNNLNARIVKVISNKPNVLAIERAIKANIPVDIISHKSFKNKDDFDIALAQSMKEAGAEWIVLAGFMRILGAKFIDSFPMHIINIHPSLLPSFPGKDAQKQALEAGVKVTGCTVHYVDYGMDTGAIIDQEAVRVLANDTRDILAERILKKEHELLIRVLNDLSK